MFLISAVGFIGTATAIGLGLLSISPPIVYLSKPYQSVNANLILYDVNTKLNHQLTEGTNILSFAPAPNGTHILYITQMNDAYAFFILDIRTGSAAFTLSDPTISVMPVWSPSGDQLIYDNMTFRTLYMVDMNSMRNQALYHYDGVGLASPDWSPDGQRVLLSATRPQSKQADLLEINLATKTTNWITNTLEAESHARYAPNGTQIVYRVLRGKEHHIEMRSLHNGVTQVLYRTDASVWSPTWSRSGQSIVFQVMEGSTSNLYELNLENQQGRWLTRNTGWNTNPTWLPNDRFFAP